MLIFNIPLRYIDAKIGLELFLNIRMTISILGKFLNLISNWTKVRKFGPSNQNIVGFIVGAKRFKHSNWRDLTFVEIFYLPISKKLMLPIWMKDLSTIPNVH